MRVVTTPDGRRLEAEDAPVVFGITARGDHPAAEALKALPLKEAAGVYARLIAWLDRDPPQDARNWKPVHPKTFRIYETRTKNHRGFVHVCAHPDGRRMAIVTHVAKKSDCNTDKKMTRQVNHAVSLADTTLELLTASDHGGTS